MPKHQLTPEEQEAAADELLKKYQEGTLTDKDTELVDTDTIGEIGSLEDARAGEPAKDSTKKSEVDDAKKKQPQLDDDGSDQGGKGGEEAGTKAPGDKGDDEEVDQGPKGDGDDTGGDPGDDGKSTEGLDEGSVKRVKDAQRKMHEATGKASRLDRENQEMKARLTALEAGKPVAPVKKPAIPDREFEKMTPEEIKALGEDYPGLAKVVAVVGGLQDENEQLRHQLADVEGDVKDTRTTTSRSRWINAIKEGGHPDVEDIQGSDVFDGWAQEQPDYIQHAIYESGTARDMIKIITDYKNDLGIESPVNADTATTDADDKTKTKSKLEQAREVTTPNLRTPARQHKPGSGNAVMMTQTEIKAFNADLQNKTPKEIEEFEIRLDKAISEGRVSPN